MIRLTYNLINALIVGLSNKNTQAALLCMQKLVDYLIEENRVLREQLKSKTGCKRIALTDAQRRRFAVKGFAVGREGLKHSTYLFQSATIIGWLSVIKAWAMIRYVTQWSILGFEIGRSTFKRILDDNGVTPEPEK